MSCVDREEALALHADGALEGTERAALELHLQSCSACRSELAALQALVGELRASRPPAGDRERFVAATVRAATRPTRAPRRLLALAGGLAAAAAAGVALLYGPAEPPEPVEAVAAAPLFEDDDDDEALDELALLDVYEFDDDAVEALDEEG